MPYEEEVGGQGERGSSGSSRTKTIDTPTFKNGRVKRIYAAAVGAGGGGGPRGGGSDNGGGGGGGGLSDGAIDALIDGNIQIRGGGGGKGSTSTGTGSRPGREGRESLVNTGGGSVSGGGGDGGRTSRGGSGGNGNVQNGGDGGDEDDGNFGGGAAGFQGTAPERSGRAGGGIDWVTGHSSGRLKTNFRDADGKNGEPGGGGGEGHDSGSNRCGGGGGGKAYAGWVILDTPGDKKVLRSGEPIDIDYEDSVGRNGDVTWNGYSNETQDIAEVTYTFTDENGAQSEYFFDVLPKVQIFNVSNTPEPQQSLDAIPKYETTITWEGISIYTAEIQKRDGGVWGPTVPPHTYEELPPNNSYDADSWEYEASKARSNIVQKVTDMRQSNADNSTISPRRTKYRLVASDGYNEVTSVIDTNAYNDDFATDPDIQDLIGREPEEEVLIKFQLQGVDMPTRITGTNCFVRDPFTLSYTTTAIYTAGSLVEVKVTTLPFNTDENGLVNERTDSLLIGRTNVSWTTQTRAPVVEELFDFGNNVQKIPFPQGAPGALETYTGSETAQSHIKSPTVIYPPTDIDNWDVELQNPWGVQIKAKDIKRQNKGDPRNQFSNLPGNDTELEVNNQRFGDTPNTNWTKPNISNL